MKLKMKMKMKMTVSNEMMVVEVPGRIVAQTMDVLLLRLIGGRSTDTFCYWF
jgi:hypothetical protein